MPKHPVTELSVYIFYLLMKQHYLSANNLPAPVFENEIIEDKMKVSVKLNNECIGSYISKFKSNAVIKAAENALMNLKKK